MNAAVDKELQSLLSYFGETPTTDAPEGHKPEDFFGLIASFSASLRVRIHAGFPLYMGLTILFIQKCALEVHESEEKAKAKSSASTTNAKAVPRSEVRNTMRRRDNDCVLTSLQRKALPTLVVPPPPPIPVGEAGIGGHRSIGRGDLDETIKSMRKGIRRERSARPLSRMFLDGKN